MAIARIFNNEIPLLRQKMMIYIKIESGNDLSAARHSSCLLDLYEQTAVKFETKLKTNAFEVYGYKM